jgi:hypothetical protein
MWSLIIFIAFNVSSRSACASVASAGSPHTNLKAADDDPVSRSEPLPASYTEAKSVVEDPGGQLAPTATPPPPRHHSHLVRKVVIVFAVCFAFALIAAVASK